MLRGTIGDAKSRKYGPALDVYFQHEDAIARGWKNGFAVTVIIDKAAISTTLANTPSEPKRWNFRSPKNHDRAAPNLRDLFADKGFTAGQVIEFSEEHRDMFRLKGVVR